MQKVNYREAVNQAIAEEMERDGKVFIMGEEVVKELIQDDFNAENLNSELHRILYGPARKAQIAAYGELVEKLGGKGASEKTAELIVKSL